MLVIRKTVHCLFGFSKGGEDNRHKCCSIPCISSGGFRLISNDPPHAPSEEAQRRPDEAPKQEKPELELDASLRGLHSPDRDHLSMCTEPLGSESCVGEMVQDMSEAVQEWGWGHKRQRQKEAEMLAKRRLPPPLPSVVGRRSRLMRAERCSGRIRLTEVKLDRRPETMRVLREDGRLRLQLVRCEEQGYVREGAAVAVPQPPPPLQVLKTCQEMVSGVERETDMWGRGAQQQRFVTAA